MYELSISDMSIVVGGSGAGKGAQGAVTGMGAYAMGQTVRGEEITAAGLVGAGLGGAIGSSSTHSVMFGAAAGAAAERGANYIGNQLDANPVNIGPGLMTLPDSTMPPLMQDQSGNDYG
ncbi:MAG: hypothetical protein Q4G28_05985 [Neisseria sp.]|nr:hypothetical protein [Neisseria sp.]